MDCQYCHKPLPGNTSYCPFCGTSLKTGGSEEREAVKKAMKSMYQQYGNELFQSKQRFIAILSDFIPEYDKERRLMTLVANNDIIANMMKENNKEVAAAKAREYMSIEMFLSDTAVEFVIECIAYMFDWDCGKSPVKTVVEPIPEEQVSKKSKKSSKQSGSQPASQQETKKEAPAEKKKKDFTATDATRMRLSMHPKIPPTYTSIDGFAFDGFGWMRSIVIPEGVTMIGEYAFSECKALKNITLPSTLRVLRKYAFNLCGKLTTIAIPNGVMSIEEGTFSFCESLMSIEIPESVGTIEQEAFVGCDSLKNLYITDNVKYIGEDAFRYCPNVVVSCKENSYVHKYCRDNGISFRFIL